MDAMTAIKCFDKPCYAYKVHQKDLILALKEFYPKLFNDNDYDGTVIPLIMEYEYSGVNDYYDYWCRLNMASIIQYVYHKTKLRFIQSLYIISNLFFICILALYLYIWFVHCNTDVTGEDDGSLITSQSGYFGWFDTAENLGMIEWRFNVTSRRDYYQSFTLFLLHFLSSLLHESTPLTYNSIYHAQYHMCVPLILWYVFEVLKNAYLFHENRKISRIVPLDVPGRASHGIRIKETLTQDELHIYETYQNYFFRKYIATALVCIIFVFYVTTFEYAASFGNQMHESLQFVYAEWIRNLCVTSHLFYAALWSGLLVLNLAKIARIIVADIWFIRTVTMCFIEWFYGQTAHVESLMVVLCNLMGILSILSIQSSIVIVVVSCIQTIGIALSNKRQLSGTVLICTGIVFGLPWILGLSSNCSLKLVCVTFIMMSMTLQFGSFSCNICHVTRPRDLFEFVFLLPKIVGGMWQKRKHEAI
eukprot:418317_1